MKNWQTTQFLTCEELAQALNQIEKDQGLKIEQIAILERWPVDETSHTPAFYLVLYRLADLSQDS